MEIVIRQIAVTDPAYNAVLQLRDEVLRRPLGMSVYDDDLTLDREDRIIAGLAADQVVGCVMIKPLGSGGCKLRQMAVSASLRGTGLGRRLVLAAEETARAADYGLVVLHARLEAVPFYERLGYAAEGDLFTEVGIPHLFMKKQIS